jgi:hypothetical protein
LSADERDSGDNQVANDDGQPEQESTDNSGQEEKTGSVVGLEDGDSGQAGLHDGEPDREEVYEESEHYADAHEYTHAHQDSADAQEETNQVVDANDESESVLDTDAIDEGPVDPESMGYQEHDELHDEDGVPDDVEAAIASAPANENVSPDAESDLSTEVRESAGAGEYSQLDESDGRLLNVCLLLTYSPATPERQAPNIVLSGSGSDYGNEEVADDFNGSLCSTYSCLI